MAPIEMFIKSEAVQGFWHPSHVIRTIKIITLLSVASLVFLDNIIQRKTKLPLSVCFQSSMLSSVCVERMVVSD